MAKSLFVLSVFFAVTTAHAQWQTQTVTLKPGWNAVYLHVDASHVTLDASVGADNANPIAEIWLWKPRMSPDRFINNPQQPVSGDDWGSWNRSASVADTFDKLIGNAAYLVRNGGAADYTWSIKGKPVPPRYDWTSKGVNFIGFATPAADPPFFGTFLSPAQRLASGGEFYRYDDGNNDLTPSLFNALFNTVRVTRGQAYWIRHAGEFNRYFGAFEIALQNSSGIQFGASGSQHSLRVRNMTAGDITLTLALVASEAPPSGQTAIAGTPPLLLRGALNSANLTYGSTALSSGSQTVTLKPRGQVGSEAELILGVNRVAMTGNAGDIFAGILRLTDSLGYTQIDLPVTANPASSSGLWVGNALVNQVRHYLKNYQRDAGGKPAQNASGQYVVASTVTSLGSVARPFNLRLIIHKSATEARLLQRAYHGIGLGNNTVVTTRESLLLPASLSSARRISAVHLPFSDGNAGWACTGQFAQGQSMSAQVNLAFGDYASNPYLHSFHPDHDNLNALFSATEVRGGESYDIERKVTLTFTPPGNDFGSLVSGGNQMTGQYAEEIVLKGRGTESRQIDTAGVFVLKRISDIATLTTQ
ncbi:MAG: hypothetical protein HYY23_01950 [Verrucomicrobia bacterium]|nr:hypothetical protein [Verrucomicrobiota bacterium]